MSNAQEQFLDIYDAYATDPELELKGKWFPIGKTGKVKVARTGNDNYNAEFKRLVDQYQADLSEGGPAAEELGLKIMVKVQAKTILLDWEGIGYQGKKVEYSVDMAETMLGIKDFRKRINAIADSFENFRAKAEEQQGNGSSDS